MDLIPEAQQPNVGPLFSAKKIAIVGISAQRSDGWGRAILNTLRAGGFPGQIWAVHPSAVIEGVDTFSAIDQLPEVPDLVAVCVPAGYVVDVIKQASTAGAKGAVVFSSGFAEHSAEGMERQNRLVEAAGDMPFVGPNCVGIANFHENLCLTAIADLANFTVGAGDVAIVTQSGAMGAVIGEGLRAANVGISHFVSTGNGSMLSGPMLGEGLLRDKRVQVLVGYIESASESAEWARLGRLAQSMNKHIVLLVVGKTSAARKAAVSHTAAATGDVLLFAGVVNTQGVVLADDEDEITDLVVALRRGHRLPKNPKFAIVTNSGGAGAILLDKFSHLNGDAAVLSPQTASALQELSVLQASVANPIDIGGNWERALPVIPTVLDLLAADPDVDAIVTYFPFGRGQEEPLRAIPEHAVNSKVPVIHVWAAPPADALLNLASADIVVPSIAAAIRRFDAMRKLPASGTLGHEPETYTDNIELQASGSTVPESIAAGILRGLGADVVESHVVLRHENYIETAVELGSGPWVVKGESAEIPHRASVGLVRLNVSTEELAPAIGETFERLAECGAGEDSRVIIQRQLSFSSVVSVGALRDEDHGPVIVVGPGGSRVESRDVRRQALGLPASAASIGAFSDELAERFDVDPNQLAQLIRAVARCLLADEAITAIEVNPAVSSSDGRLVAVDALIDLGSKNHADVLVKQ